jgi:hypothetical protein
MATACYPRNHSFTVKESIKTTETGEVSKPVKPGSTKPNHNVMKCRFCHYRFPYPATSYESQMMNKVANCTGERLEIHYYCPSSEEVLDRLAKVGRLISEKRYKKLLNLFAGYSSTENCCVKFEEAQKRKREADWLNAQRAKYARKNKVVGEEDYPKHLQKERSSPRQEVRTPSPKTVMGRDSRTKKIQEPRYVVEDYESSDSGYCEDY